MATGLIQLRGNLTSIGDTPFANKTFLSFTPPGKNSRGEDDWVLVLSAKKRE